MTVIHNHTYFLPTSPARLLDLLCSKAGVLTPVGLYDLARFVEDFVLADVLYVPQYFHNILIPYLQEHDPACHLFLLDEEELLEDRLELLHPNARTYLDIEFEETLQKRAKKFLSYDKASEPSEADRDEFSKLLYDLLNANAVLGKLNVLSEIPRLFDTELAGRRILCDEFIINNVDNPLKLSKYKWTIDDVSRIFSSLQISVSPGVGFVRVCKDSEEGLNKELYSHIAKAFKIKISRLERILNTHFIYTPPLLTILLNESTDKSELLQKLCWLRAEFSDLREITNDYEEEITKADSLKDKLEIIENLENSQKALSLKMSHKKHKSLVRRVWDITKEASLWKGLAKGVDSLVETFEQRRALRRVHRYMDMYDLAISAKQYEDLLPKVFGQDGIDDASFSNLDRVSQVVVRAIESK
jgi:hypothetical protein